MATISAISAAPNGLIPEVPWIVDRIGDRRGSRRILYIFIKYHYNIYMYLFMYIVVFLFSLGVWQDAVEIERCGAQMDT